jgi:AraC family transcriptional regulator
MTFRPDKADATCELAHATLFIDTVQEEDMNLAEPRFENGPAKLIAGLGGHYTAETNKGIPALWERFGPTYMDRVPGQVGGDAYGVCYNFAPNAEIDYLAGVEVTRFEGLPAELARLSIPPQTYAVFPHAGHVSELSELWMEIFQEWLPKSGREFVGGPSYERYAAAFDPKSGTGGMEIWVALKN